MTQKMTPVGYFSVENNFYQEFMNISVPTEFSVWNFHNPTSDEFSSFKWGRLSKTS